MVRFSLSALVAALLALAGARSAIGNDPLPSWNDGLAKQAITDFVMRVTAAGGPDFVPPAERIAVFDNDGTLWGEQPVYVQLAFMFDRVKALAPNHPEWKSKEPFASLLRGDPKAALAGGEQGLLAMMAATHSGMTTDEFARSVSDWISTARHPKTDRHYTEMVYEPMLELLAYLRGNGFKPFIVSGGGVEFMRPWAERVYGIPPEQVIGSSGKLDKALDEAIARGWTVVDMKKDWNVMYPFQGSVPPKGGESRRPHSVRPNSQDHRDRNGVNATRWKNSSSSSLATLHWPSSSSPSWSSRTGQRRRPCGWWAAAFVTRRSKSDGRRSGSGLRSGSSWAWNSSWPPTSSGR